MKHSNAVMEDAFSFGNHQAVDDNARDYVVDNIRQFVASAGRLSRAALRRT